MRETIKAAESLEVNKNSDVTRTCLFTDEGFEFDSTFVSYGDVIKIERRWRSSSERNGMIRFRVKNGRVVHSYDLFYLFEESMRVDQIISFILLNSEARLVDNTSSDEGASEERSQSTRAVEKMGEAPESKYREQTARSDTEAQNKRDDDLRMPGIGFSFTSQDIPKLQALGDRVRDGLRKRLLKQWVLVLGIPAAIIIVGKLIVNSVQMAADSRHELSEAIIIVNSAIINCLTIPSLVFTWKAMRYLKKNRDGLNPSNAYKYAKVIEGSIYMVEHPWKLDLSAILRKKPKK